MRSMITFVILFEKCKSFIRWWIDFIELMNIYKSHQIFFDSAVFSALNFCTSIMTIPSKNNKFNCKWTINEK